MSPLNSNTISVNAMIYAVPHEAEIARRPVRLKLSNVSDGVDVNNELPSDADDWMRFSLVLLVSD